MASLAFPAFRTYVAEGRAVDPENPIRTLRTGEAFFYGQVWNQRGAQAWMLGSRSVSALSIP